MQQQQHHQAGGGGSAQQFGLHPPDMPPFLPAGSAGQQRIPMAEGPSPISSRPPAPVQQQPNNELGDVGFDDEALAAAAAGEDGAAGGAGGNRWPRQETLALLKIRSDMDAAFRDATLKGPLWEEVSRKLAEEGYRRNGKKCKEKFENVHKYYKRTKDSRAGRNDGKTYRFFQQLEALHGTAAGAAASPVPVAPPAATAVVGVPGVVGPSAVRPLAEPPPVPVVGGNHMSFSTSDYSDEEGDSDDDEGTDDMGEERGKRKRTTPEGAGRSGKMMRFFEGLMKQVTERQEAMQQRFLEAMEKREQDRMIREEAWRRQEMVRLGREQETLAQERAMAATRDAAVLSFIQKITGQTIPMPPPSIAAPAIAFMPPPPSSQNHAMPISFSVAPPPTSSQPQTTHSHQRQPSPRPQKPPTMPPAAPQKSPAPVATPQPQPPPQQQALVAHQSSSTDVVMSPVVETPPDAHGSGGGAASSSRWPKAEVHALIQLRSNLDMRYQEAGPKGPLWEEISAGMGRMGYSRSSKRCKEKWENINKYFKKVKESNKKRPEDSKTCPYFHQLDALYRNKAAALGSPSGSGGSGGVAALPPPPQPAAEHANAAASQEAFTVAAPISQTAPQQPPHTQLPPVAKNGDVNGHVVGGVSGGVPQMQQASNGAANRFVFSETGGRATTAKKPQDIMKETTMTLQPQPQATINSYSRTAGGGGAADYDNNNMDEDEDEEDEDDYSDEEEDDEDLDGNKMQYEMFQRQHQQQHQHQPQHHNVVRPNPGAAAGGGNPPGATCPSAAAATTTAGSFLGMVQ